MSIALSFSGVPRALFLIYSDGKVDADSDLPIVDASVSIAYDLSDIATTFRSQCGSTAGSFNQATSVVTVSAGPNITEAGSASVSITGLLTPRVDIGPST
jgi:hypothetical protein